MSANAENRIPLERTVSVRSQQGWVRKRQGFESFIDAKAWVLIADPGAGKTDVFRSLEIKEGGKYMKAVDFIDLEVHVSQNTTLFLDGLDEVTARSANGSSALGQIRTKLQKLGTPKCRISCREADWRGNTDSAALIALVGAENFFELHLDPLERGQIIKLIQHWQNCDESSARSFVKGAQERDLDGLLDNPQTLRMLVKAVASNSNQPPTSKTQTYAMACKVLVQEPNDVHVETASHTTPVDGKLLDAAGFLCAVMLLSGKPSIAKFRTANIHPEQFALADLGSYAMRPSDSDCNAVLHRRLFKGEARGEFFAVHRTIAEYLGARYLVSRIDVGLPARRVLALMLGDDGGVVPALRGLHAWLAACATGELRSELIRGDVLGVVLNGDVRDFTRIEKLAVLEALKIEATRYTYFRNQSWASNPFGALATSDMEGDFKNLLRSGDRSPEHLALVDCLVDALAHGHEVLGLRGELEAMVRDASYSTHSRNKALDILIRYTKEDDDWGDLLQLLNDLQVNAVQDPDDELLGELLPALYPGRMLASKLWQVFHTPKNIHYIGGYWEFWNYLGVHIAPDSDVPVLLDAFLELSLKLDHVPIHVSLNKVVGDLLQRALKATAPIFEPARLHKWLAIGVNDDGTNVLTPESKASIAKWLTEHPQTFKALFELALEGLQAGQINQPDRPKRIWPIRELLCEASDPPDAARWYQELAKTTLDKGLREQLVGSAFHWEENHFGIDAAITLAERWRDSNPADVSWINRFLQSTYPPSEDDQRYHNSTRNHRLRVANAARESIRFFREVLPNFATSEVHLGALNAVANAYLKPFSGSSLKTPVDGLLALLNQDQSWVSLALEGLRQSIFRVDLPSAAEIIDLGIKDSEYNIGRPCLAAMDLRFHEHPDSVFNLPESTLESVATFQLTSRFKYKLPWFDELLARQPALLAGVLRRMITRQLKAKKENVEGVHALARDEAYAEVAKQIVLELLTNFPVKAAKHQLYALRFLIDAAVQYLPAHRQLDLVDSKLGGLEMDKAQHVYWLMTGLQIAPDMYLDAARKFINQTQSRAQHVLAFLREPRKAGAQQATFSIGATVFLIELFGPTNYPRSNDESLGVREVTRASEMGRYVDSLISALAGQPSDAAQAALIELQSRADLKQWQPSFQSALYDQQITRRSAFFKPASVAAVVDTLANLKPANAQDLWALTVDHLNQLARNIRDGSTDDHDQYWAGNEPKSESLCRNALLSDLKLRLLAVGVSAESEPIHADNTRADIKVIFAPHQVPIEIKCEWHKDLWTAIPQQLIAKYGRDPASDGYGIYLVFWFSGKRLPVPSDGGKRPVTPQELKQRLEATVPNGLRHKIAVLVVDCSKPLRQT